MIEKFSSHGKIVELSKYDKIFNISNCFRPDTKILGMSETLNVKGFMKTAGSNVVKIAPQEQDFIYIRIRAVSAGNVIEHKDGTYELVPIDEYYKNFEKYAPICRNANINGDFFSHEELKRVYKTFIGKSVFVDHNNEQVSEARGIILDAVYNENGYFVELLEAIDKKAFPQLAQAIEKRYITDTSMGCRCGKTRCSICGNIARTEDDLCEHILNYKGLMYNGLPVFEDNYEVDFFEDSIVTEGADPDAKILEKVAGRKYMGAGNISVYHKKSRNKIKEEKNQRMFEGKVKNLTEQLNELWD